MEIDIRKHPQVRQDVRTGLIALKVGRSGARTSFH